MKSLIFQKDQRSKWKSVSIHFQQDVSIRSTTGPRRKSSRHIAPDAAPVWSCGDIKVRFASARGNSTVPVSINRPLSPLPAAISIYTS